MNDNKKFRADYSGAATMTDFNRTQNCAPDRSTLMGASVRNKVTETAAGMRKFNRSSQESFMSYERAVPSDVGRMNSNSPDGGGPQNFA